MAIWLVLALVIGLALPVQTGLNAQLRTAVGSPFLAALVSFVVGTVALLLVTLGSRAPLPDAAAVGRTPWWLWTGGLLGASYIAATIVLAPRLGAALLVVAITAGQLLASLVVDHFGWIGYAPHPMNGWRVLGAACVVIGVVLIQRY
ncbi:MAG: DMT family transporter [Gemmatimonadales bacterium]|nr:DMT family transporter [Gemmatimonadales bacterium]